jgi:hypothetical protein
MKVVAEERSVQVPRVVEKKTPYTYTVRMPRTVVTKVPLDPCGNPLPAAAAAATPAAMAPALPAAATYETVPAPAASSARPETPPTSAPLKTFSDKPAAAAAPVGEGWTASPLQHVDPAKTAGVQSRVAEKPLADSAVAAEAIPSPSAAVPSVTVPAEPTPTVAPAGPAVEPAQPAHDLRDVPSAKTSGAGFLKPILTPDHTT